MFDEVIERGFVIEGVDIREDKIVYRVVPRYSHEKSFSLVLKSIESINKNVIPFYRETKEGYEIILARSTKKEKKIRPEINFLLFITTFITTTWAGYVLWAEGDFRNSLIFAASLLSILGVHELGHAITARKRGIKSTLPIFIPVPPPVFPFGTLGAVIFMNSPVPNRKALIDVGIAGPIAGFCLSIPIAIMGLAHSTPTPLSSISSKEFVLGPSLLFYLIMKLFFGDLTNKVLVLHPLAIAGWAGIFVTSLNLLPIGQLDGGHVIRGIFPMHYRKIYYATLILLLFLGLLWPGWIVWAIIVSLLTKLRHPGPLDDVSELDAQRKFMLAVMIIILILSFMPVPILTGELFSKNI